KTPSPSNSPIGFSPILPPYHFVVVGVGVCPIELRLVRLTSEDVTSSDVHCSQPNGERESAYSSCIQLMEH
ncbi:MAG: hypothetical protein AAGE92_09100, partial [Cyanobacteria bacterium P01_G01_bin.4]